MIRPGCEWCHQLATAELTAHWSVFDWIDYLACQDHLTAAEYLAVNTLIDGTGPSELHWRYFDSLTEEVV